MYRYIVPPSRRARRSSLLTLSELHSLSFILIFICLLKFFNRGGAQKNMNGTDGTPDDHNATCSHSHSYYWKTLHCIMLHIPNILHTGHMSVQSTILYHDALSLWSSRLNWTTLDYTATRYHTMFHRAIVALLY